MRVGHAVLSRAGPGGGGGSDFCAFSQPAPASLSDCAVTGTNSSFGTASVTITYTPLPTSTDQCKNGGWQNLGGLFKDQGDCVSFVATGGKNPPSGS